MLPETASRVPKREVFLKRPNLLICREMRSGGTTRLIKLPRWHCQGDGTVPVFWQVNGNAFGMGRTAGNYGFTCTLASKFVNWFGRCREFLAFTCTIDKELEPGASAVELVVVPGWYPAPP